MLSVAGEPVRALRVRRRTKEEEDRPWSMMAMSLPDVQPGRLMISCMMAAMDGVVLTPVPIEVAVQVVVAVVGVRPLMLFEEAAKVAASSVSSA